MLEMSAANAAALASGRLVPRDFLWAIARNRTSLAAVPVGFWSGIGPITVQVINPDTGALEARGWNGAGQLIKISDVPRVANITVQTVTIELSQIDEAVDDMVRDYDLRFGRVEIYRGLFDPFTRLLVAPPICRFIGLVDDVDVKTPAEGGDGSCSLTCVSHTQELTRANSDKRDDDSQKRRAPGDNFYKYTNVVGDWSDVWGKAKKQKKSFLGKLLS